MKKRVLCFGDSNTYGYDGASDERFDENTRWTGVLANLLGDEYTVIEEGHNGRTTVWDDPIENRMAGIKYLWPCMDSASPIDVIVIMLGTNDCKMYFGSSATSIANGAGRLVDMAMKSNFGRDKKAPAVILVAPILINKENGLRYLFDDASVARSIEFPEQFERVAKEYGCYFLNAQEHAVPGTADGIHMDAENHRKLAEALCEKIKGIIG